MPGTLYAKMNLLLRECAARPGTPLDNLTTSVLQKGYYEFVVSRRVEDRLVQEPCQEATVRRILYTLSDLGLVLINGGCTLSIRGESALEDYATVLGQAVLEHLQRVYGLSLTIIRDAIWRVKVARGSDVPSAAQIYNQLLAARALKQPISEERLSTWLNLLARCGVLTSYFRKYYW
ncbi:MAG: hypothetical protein FJ026_14225 [Chloroflexi bacterium]|nr:hypothetical protein [Chloroflexota bacterium]